MIKILNEQELINKKWRLITMIFDKNYLEGTDLSDVFKELEEANAQIEEVEEDEEMAASQRRFEEIIKKHREDGGKGNL